MTVEQILLALITMVVTATGGAIGHLYALVGRMQDRHYEAMHEISEDREEDRKAMALLQIQIAQNMVTKLDLREELNRMLNDLDRRLHWNSKPRSGGASND